MTFDKRAWMIFFVIVIGLIALWFLFFMPTRSEVRNDFGKVERVEPGS